MYETIDPRLKSVIQMQAKSETLNKKGALKEHNYALYAYHNGRQDAVEDVLKLIKKSERINKKGDK